MRRFQELFRALDGTRRTSVKEARLAEYFAAAPPGDAAWAAHLLLGRRGRRAVSTRLLREWAADAGGYPLWLVEESYDAVGDLAETLALLVPEAARPAEPPGLAEFMATRVEALADLDDAAKEQLVRRTWEELDGEGRFLFHKLVSGGFRVGVARGLVAKALARVAGVDRAVMLHRLSGKWTPTAAAWTALMEGTDDGARGPSPYPFFLAHPVPDDVAELGDPAAFQAEWKWDGIRAQAVRRGGELLLWSRGEDLVNPGFPEVAEDLRALPDGTVLDGELLAWRADRPLPFHELQRRIQRKSVPRKLRAEVPVRFLAYDLLEEDHVDLRERPLVERRARLEALVERAGLGTLHLAPTVDAEGWDGLAALRDGARARGVEGLMLKLRASPYGAGRVRGPWWKWKVDPFTLDTVLVMAQRGHGRRASLYTDYTLAVWSEGELVPVAKAYSGLTDAEIRRVDAFVRRNITERFGPVRAVRPELVFELAFEGVRPSPRHRAGLALRFPRIARWREDKPAAEADTLEAVRALVETLSET